MVNDLKPNLPKRLPDDTQRVLVSYVSLTRTQGLIELCVSRYVDSYQCHESVRYATQTRELNAQGQSKANPDYQRSPASPNSVTLGRKQSSPPSPSRPFPTPPPTSSDVSKEPSMPAVGRSRADSSKAIFRTLENYILACFDGIECLNASFSLAKPPLASRAKSEGSMVPTVQSSEQGQTVDLNAALSPVDAKTLLLGDFAENGMWWTGGSFGIPCSPHIVAFYYIGLRGTVMEDRFILEPLCLSVEHANQVICNRRYENRAESLS